MLHLAEVSLPSSALGKRDTWGTLVTRQSFAEYNQATCQVVVRPNFAECVNHGTRQKAVARGMLPFVGGLPSAYGKETWQRGVATWL